MDISIRNPSGTPQTSKRSLQTRFHAEASSGTVLITARGLAKSLKVSENLENHDLDWE